ncbi:tyrosine-type recombinase/integrase [Nonomuraea sp. NPDC046802]|uniref:tyrosine-type recombinase/integrase n=1 Tax=Nonomuraea sp. NPDC046802 TaxID=3154919 RepID=UPI0033CCD523
MDRTSTGRPRLRAAGHSRTTADQASDRVGRLRVTEDDQERDVPMADWVAEYLRSPVERYEPPLPWEKPSGKPRTHNILFRWASDDRHVRQRVYAETIWKPALMAAGVIPKPKRDSHRRLRYTTTWREGTHQLRRYNASVMLPAGVSINELAEYLGHSDPAFTLRVYAHMQTSSLQRAREAIDRRMRRPAFTVGQN